MEFQVNLDEETRKLLKNFLKELGILNIHIKDIKTMIAPLLGFRVITDEDKD